jgi:O-antigen/teichoic acid export membrane protein
MTGRGRAAALPPEGAASSRIVRGTAAYTIAAILQRAVVFLLLPFFSRVLTPAEFGEIGIITTLASALAVLISLGLETAIFRGYLRVARDARGSHALVNTVGGFALIAPIGLAAIISASAAPALAATFHVQVNALYLASAGAAANASATLVPLALMRAQERLGDYVRLTALQVIATPTLTILFVAILGWAVMGWMLAYALSSSLLLVRGLTMLHHRWSPDLDLMKLRSALRFGLPLVPHALSHWGLAVSDRAILGAFVAAPQVGAYYVAFLFSLPVSLVSIALSQATQPLYAEAITSPGRRAELGRVITVQVLFVMLSAATVALVGPPASLLLFPADYAMTASLIPWLAIGACFFGLYLVPMNALTLMAGRTERVWIITALAAVINVALNLILVPRFGSLAAAVDTVVAYGALLVGVFLYSQRACDPRIPYDGARISVGGALIGAPCLVAAWVTPPDPPTAVVMRTALTLGVAMILVVGPLNTAARMALRAIRPIGNGGRR